MITPKQSMAEQARIRQMGREHEAWLHIMRELRERQIEPNDTSNDRLCAAIRLWGEELHQMRIALADPDQDSLVLAQTREDYYSEA